MSIMIIEKGTCEKLTNSSYLLKDVNYGKTMYFDDLYNYIQTLYNMNIRSYNFRYDEAVLMDNINKNSKKKFNNVCEVLKALQCLSYNIEEEPQDKNEFRCVEWLESEINMIKDYLISNLDDYKNAIWG